jgi:hypothetical protein
MDADDSCRSSEAFRARPSDCLSIFTTVSPQPPIPPGPTRLLIAKSVQDGHFRMHPALNVVTGLFRALTAGLLMPHGAPRGAPFHFMFQRIGTSQFGLSLQRS